MKRQSITVLAGIGLASMVSFAHAAEEKAKPSRGSASYENPSGPSTRAFPGDCGIQMNMPHASHENDHQIHARSESFCKTQPLVSNRVEMWLYRSRWYGWEEQGHESNSTKAPSKEVQRMRTTVVSDCAPNSWHRWRAVARGEISTGAQHFTAAVYEENNDEIQCKKGR